MEKHIFILALVLSLSLESCSTESAVTKGFTKNTVSCDLKGSIIKEVTQRKGTIWYVNSLEKYSIVAIPEGHYDTIEYSVLCDIPDELKKVGMVILFSGKYHENFDGLPTGLGGLEYYDLNLIEYKIIGID